MARGVGCDGRLDMMEGTGGMERRHLYIEPHIVLSTLCVQQIVDKLKGGKDGSEGTKKESEGRKAESEGKEERKRREGRKRR